MRYKIRSGLYGPTRVMFGKVCSDVWFVFWREIRYDVIELRVIWHPNFIDTCLNINPNSIKPRFLDEEYVCVVAA